MEPVSYATKGATWSSLIIRGDSSVEVEIPLAAHSVVARCVSPLVDVVFGPAEAREIFPGSLRGRHCE